MLTKAKLSYVQSVLKQCLPVPKQLCTVSYLESIHAQDTFPDIKQCKVSSVHANSFEFFYNFSFFRYRKDAIVEIDAFEIK